MILAELALSLSLDHELLLSASELRNRGQLNPRLLASVLEALVGAVYLDGGYNRSKKVVKHLLGAIIKKGPVNRDYKSFLQEHVQKQFQKIPTYNLLEIKGPNHDKVFVMEVRIEERILGTGTGHSKKQATQSAALSALKEMGISLDS